MEEEQHIPYVWTNNSEVFILECTCGWNMNPPYSTEKGVYGWAVRELVSLTNEHLVKALT